MSFTADLATHLRLAKTQAYIEDQIEESLIDLNLFQRLDLCAEVEFARKNFYFVQDRDGVHILCYRDGKDKDKEATLFFTAPLRAASTMPYSHYSELNRNETFVPGAHQFVVLADAGVQNFANVKKAIRIFHVMAELRCTVGSLHPLRDLEIDGQSAICVSTPISTPRHRLLPGDEPLGLTHEQDPRGVVNQYCVQRDHVILIDNQVDVYLAAHLEKAGEFELWGDGVAGKFLRPGQIVRVEVGFRIVPAGQKAIMKMDLKSVVIINDDIVASMAFAEVDLENEDDDKAKAKNTRTISVASAGPSSVVIDNRPKVERASRKPKGLVKNVAKDGMQELPFQQ